jgi:tetratricopeptide (TPR) repeat protein
MGFLRKWYRNNCADTKTRAQMFLTDGEYAKAASDFQSCSMYWEAAEAYIKAGEKEPGGFYYKWAAENYEKAGDFESMRRACETAWHVKPHWMCLKDNFERLITHDQFEKFLENAKKKEPKTLASSLEHIEQYEIACDMYILAAEQQEDVKAKHDFLCRAIDCGRKETVNMDKLLQLHEEYFKTDAAQANSWTDLMFRGRKMAWVVESGNLLKFIDDVVNEFPVFLWYVLHEYAIDPDTSPDVLRKNRKILAKGMLRCVKRTENNPSLNKGWEFLGEEENYCSATVGQLSLAGMFIDAAEILERTGKYKEAAGLAEKAGKIELAIHLYEQALKEKGISNTEADWIKSALQRLRKEREKPSATIPVQPEDYM